MAYYKVTRIFNSKKVYMVEADNSDLAIREIILYSDDCVVKPIKNDVEFVEWEVEYWNKQIPNYITTFIEK